MTSAVRYRSPTDTPFFRGIVQKDLPIRQYGGKSPMFFAEASVMGGLFPVDGAVAQALLPDSNFRAIMGPTGSAYMGVMACEYGYTDLGPYNEVFLTIGISYGTSAWPHPLRVGGRFLARSLDAHVIQLPVDSEAALFGGIDYYNVPKYMAEVSFADFDGVRCCSVRDPQSGALIYELRGTRPAHVLRLPFSPLRRQTMLNYARMQDRTITARFELHSPAPFFRAGSKHASLTLGSHPRADTIQRLRPGPSLGYFFAEGCEAILYEPVEA